MSKREVVNLIWLVGIMIGLSGCVSPIALHQQVPDLSYKANGKVLVTVIDERERIKEAERDSSFIGVARMSFGIPMDWHVSQVLATEEGDEERDLPSWLEHRIANGLVQRGWEAEAYHYSVLPKPEEVMTALKSSGATKLLSLTLREWFFDLNTNWVTSFHFDTNAEVRIFDAVAGNTLTKEFEDSDIIEESASESPQNNILRAYKAQLQQILNDADVRNALSK